MGLHLALQRKTSAQSYVMTSMATGMSLFIASKAGFDMWPGPYGNLGSKKYLVASLDQSLKRMGLDYVDVFYHHRPDPDTPLYETMSALDLIVRQGKALYVGISNYPAETAAEALQILQDLGTPCLIHQARYSMMDRWVEDGLLNVLERRGSGLIAFSPLEQGMLTSRYLDGIPEGSRAAKSMSYLDREFVEKANSIPEKAERICGLTQPVIVSNGCCLASQGSKGYFCITWSKLSGAARREPKGAGSAGIQSTRTRRHRQCFERDRVTIVFAPRYF